jgi:hypothetical protein
MLRQYLTDVSNRIFRNTLRSSFLVPVVHSARYVGVEEYVRARGLKHYRRVGGRDVDVGKCAQDERKQFVVGLVKEPESYAPRIGRVKGGEVAKCHQESHHRRLGTSEYRRQIE